MPRDEFAPGVAAVDGSRIAGFGRRAMTWWRHAVARSLAARIVMRMREQIHAIDLADRLRLAGVVLLSATTTVFLLGFWVPPMERPAIPAIVAPAFAGCALALILAPGRIAAAWRTSRLVDVPRHSVGGRP
jgi:hypothetical protein